MTERAFTYKHVDMYKNYFNFSTTIYILIFLNLFTQINVTLIIKKK